MTGRTPLINGARLGHVSIGDRVDLGLPGGQPMTPKELDSANTLRLQPIGRTTR